MKKIILANRNREKFMNKFISHGKVVIKVIDTSCSNNS